MTLMCTRLQFPNGDAFVDVCTPHIPQRDVTVSCDNVRLLLIQLVKEEVGGATGEKTKQSKEQIWNKLEVS